MKRTQILWFTGLSGSGKTTITQILSDELIQGGFQVKLIDGDVVRKQYHQTLGFSKEDITLNNKLITALCIESKPHFNFIIVSTISPLLEARAFARASLHPLFSEVYVKASLEECMKRDVKGLYKKALKGEIKNFIGLSTGVMYEPPQFPDLILDTEMFSLQECLHKLMNYLKQTNEDLGLCLRKKEY